MKINFRLTEDTGNDITLKDLVYKLSMWSNVDEDGNVRRVGISLSSLDTSMILQVYSEDPKLKEDVCLY